MASPARGRRLGVGTLFLALWVASCDTANRPTGPDLNVGPSYAISDGAHLGNPNFFFLPPIVKDPMASGTFDGSLSPRVEVCVLVEDSEPPGDLVCAAGDPFWSATDVAADLLEEQYAVNWQTDEVQVGQTYRIQVFSGTRLLGFSDVAFPENKGEAKKLGSDETILLNDGRTLPIKFRIEEFAELTAVGCEPDGSTILDCDVVAVPRDAGEGSVSVSDPADSHTAAIVTVPDVDFDYFLTLELLPLDDYPAPAGDIPEDNQFPYFVSITAVDESGAPVAFADDGPGNEGASLVLCQEDGAEDHAEHAWLRAFRVDEGVTTLWPKEYTQWAITECGGDPDFLALRDAHGHETGHSVFDVLVDAGKRRLATLFLPQPLRAMHGGLNPIGIDKFSEWGATVVEPEGFEVSGTVYFSAGAAEGATVQLLARADNSVVASHVTDASGTFSFPGTPPGEYYVALEGSGYVRIWRDLDVTDADQAGLTYEIAKPIAQVSPAADATGVELQPTVTWTNAVPEVATYTLWVDECSPISSVVTQPNITPDPGGTTSYTLEVPLTPETCYTSRVWGYDAVGRWVASTNPWSSSFTTGPAATLPDLVVSALTLDPTTLSPGDELTYTYTRSNLGAAAPEYPDNSTWDNQVYISTDEFLDGSDITLPSAYTSSTYPVGEGFTVTNTVTRAIPDDLPAGTYYLIYLVDAGISSSYPGVVESNEDNNWLATPFTVVEPASISGHVYVDGAPVAGVVLQATSTYGTLSAITDASGHYAFPVFSPAEYTVFLFGALPPGDFAVSSKVVTVAAGDDVTVDFDGALLYDTPLGTGGAATWTVADPSTPVSLCNGEGSTSCASSDGSTIWLRVLATGPITMPNPWVGGRIYFYSYRPDTGHYVYLGWVAGSAAGVTGDGSTTRIYYWSLSFDATGEPVGPIQVLAVGTGATYAPNSRTPVNNTNITIVPGS